MDQWALIAVGALTCAVFFLVFTGIVLFRQLRVSRRQVEEMSAKMSSEYVGNARQIDLIGTSLEQIRKVLALPHLRGRLIGERALERLLTDFLPTGHYGFQVDIGGKRVDACLKFPELNLIVPIDSKFPLEQVEPLFSSNQTEDAIREARRRLATYGKRVAREIREKYIRPELGTTDYGFLFLPSESLYFEVVANDELWGKLMEERVYPVSPNTFAASLATVGHAIQYYRQAQSVDEKLSNLLQCEESLDRVEQHIAELSRGISQVQQRQDRVSQLWLKMRRTLAALPSQDENQSRMNSGDEKDLNIESTIPNHSATRQASPAS